jgi:hypothetical protein
VSSEVKSSARIPASAAPLSGFLDEAWAWRVLYGSVYPGTSVLA